MNPEWTDNAGGIAIMFAMTGTVLMLAIGSLVSIWRERKRR